MLSLCTGRAFVMDRGGGTWPPRLCRSVALAAWPRYCRAAARAISRPDYTVPGIAHDAAALLVRQTLAVTGQPVQAAAWHDLPTTYVVCTEDRGTPAAAQREFARRADNIIEVKAGHHPFLSQPQTIADIIARLS